MTRSAPIARIPLRRLAPWPLPPQQARPVEIPPTLALCGDCGTTLVVVPATLCASCVQARRCT